MLAWKDCVTQDHIKAVWTASMSISRCCLLQFYQQDTSDLSFENHVNCQDLSEMLKKKKVLQLWSYHLSFLVKGEGLFKCVISELQQDRALLFIHANTHDALADTHPRVHQHIITHPWLTHSFLTDGHETWKRASHIFPIEASDSFEIVFSFPSPLPFFVLSCTLHHCLRKSLTQLGLPPVSAEEIQGLPEEQSQDQGPAAPSFHVKSLPFYPLPFSFRPILFPFLGRGWGSNDGR